MVYLWGECQILMSVKQGCREPYLLCDLPIFFLGSFLCMLYIFSSLLGLDCMPGERCFIKVHENRLGSGLMCCRCWGWVVWRWFKMGSCEERDLLCMLWRPHWFFTVQVSIFGLLSTKLKDIVESKWYADVLFWIICSDVDTCVLALSVQMNWFEVEVSVHCVGHPLSRWSERIPYCKLSKKKKKKERER